MAGFWGQPGLDRMTPQTKRDLPAFWSVRTHGQPFNDPRLTEGASNHFKVASPPALGAPAPKPSGPATECLATLKSSLQNGFAMFHDDSRLTPKRLQPGTMSTLREYVHTLLSLLVVHSGQHILLRQQRFSHKFVFFWETQRAPLLAAVQALLSDTGPVRTSGRTL